MEKGYILGTQNFINELNNDFGIVSSFNEAEFVLVSFDRELTYSKLENACILINRGVPFYLTHIDLSCPTENGPIPDCGAFSKLISIVTSKFPKDNWKTF